MHTTVVILKSCTQCLETGPELCCRQLIFEDLDLEMHVWHLAPHTWFSSRIYIGLVMATSCWHPCFLCYQILAS